MLVLKPVVFSRIFQSGPVVHPSIPFPHLFSSTPRGITESTDAQTSCFIATSNSHRRVPKLVQRHNLSQSDIHILPSLTGKTPRYLDFLYISQQALPNPECEHYILQLLYMLSQPTPHPAANCHSASWESVEVNKNKSSSSSLSGSHWRYWRWWRCHPALVACSERLL